MVKNIVDKKYKHIGVVIDEFFIPDNYEKYLVSDLNYNQTLLYTDCNRFNINLDNFKEFILCCRKNNIKLNDIIFVCCSPYSLDIEEMSEFWRMSDMSHKFNFYVCIDTISCSIVAYMLLKGYLYSNNIHIGMIEVINKSHGYGTRIVNQLKSLDKHISGLSMVTAKSFWEKQGAVFTSQLNFQI